MLAVADCAAVRKHERGLDLLLAVEDVLGARVGGRAQVDGAEGLGGRLEDQRLGRVEHDAARAVAPTQAMGARRL